jgi:hypothetical protein
MTMHSLIRFDRQEPNWPRESIHYLLPIPKDQGNSRLKYGQERRSQNRTGNASTTEILGNLSTCRSDIVGTKVLFSFGVVSWL